MMMVMSLLNGDDYACFVVLRLGNTSYYFYAFFIYLNIIMDFFLEFNGFTGEFLVITYRDFSRFFFQKIREIMSIYISQKPAKS